MLLYKILLLNSDAQNINFTPVSQEGHVEDGIRLPCRSSCVTVNIYIVWLIALVMSLFQRNGASTSYVCFPLLFSNYRISSLIDILVALSILMGYSVTTASFVTYVVREHQTKAKQLQHISGIGVTCYWVTNFIYDMVSSSFHSKKDSINLNRS